MGNEVVPPYTGFRLWLFRIVMKTYCKIHLSVVYGLSVKHEDPEYDYSYYLGPNYKEV